MSKSLFIPKLLARSKERNFEIARREWVWTRLVEGQEHTCLCGRKCKDEVCCIENKTTGARAMIGSCCAQEFLGWPAKNIFAAWSRVCADPDKSFNEPFVEFAHANGLLSDWERDFYVATWRKRALSPEQARKRKQINYKVMRTVRESPLEDQATRERPCAPKIPL